MRYALTRDVSPTITNCELTHIPRQAIDIARAQQQHANYRDLLANRGYTVIRLPTDPAEPDCVFVEDTAIVGPDYAVITNPGAASRRSEIGAVAQTLARFRDIERISAPAMIDGGDVLQVGRSIWVGRTDRTNDSGIAALRRSLEPRGVGVRTVAVQGCLHLKSAVTAAGPDTVVLNPDWVSARSFGELDVVEVHPEEPSAANVLYLADTTVVSAAFVRTRERLEQRGVATCAIDMSELAKAEGALTCCSILFEA